MGKTCAAHQWWSNGLSKRATDAIEIDMEGTGLAVEEDAEVTGVR